MNFEFCVDFSSKLLVIKCRIRHIGTQYVVDIHPELIASVVPKHLNLHLQNRFQKRPKNLRQYKRKTKRRGEQMDAEIVAVVVQTKLKQFRKK